MLAKQLGYALDRGGLDENRFGAAYCTHIQSWIVLMLTVLGPTSISFPPARKPLVGRVSCGFPSPALEYAEPPLSLDELVRLREPSRWLVRADGDSLNGLGIYHDDIMVVCKALDPVDGDVLVVSIGPDFVAKQYCERPGQSPLLLAHNPAYPNIEVGDWEEIELWGVVVWNLHRVSR